MCGADFNMTFHGTREINGTGVYKGPLYADLTLAFQALHVVDNTGPAAVGGGGAPLVNFLKYKFNNSAIKISLTAAPFSHCGL